MLNAIQARIVEESLVEAEVYEAMEKMRARIDAVAGTGSSGAPAAPVQGDVPDLPDLPVGTPPPGSRAARAAAPVPRADGDMVPVPVPQPASQIDTGAGVPSDVMAVADPLRDAQRKVVPYVPPTSPSSGSDPFPQLGPKGRPLG